MKKNIVLIGMPGAGKSTVGVLLAKSLGMDFCDTDILIQKQTGTTLQETINSKGLDEFLKIENSVLAGIKLENTVIATGGSAVAAITAVKKRGYKNIRLMCLVGVKEGIEAVEKAHPDVDIYIAAVDEKLNEVGYILPGLGDAGDRIFGTK